MTYRPPFNGLLMRDILMNAGEFRSKAAGIHTAGVVHHVAPPAHQVSGSMADYTSLLSNKSIWLTQEPMAELFGEQHPAIIKRLKNIFESNVLQNEVVCSVLERTMEHGTKENGHGRTH